MNFRALRYFIAIADAGSLSAAAPVVSIAQPALSRQLRELENDLGTRLLLRSSRGVRLTPAGVTFYESAQRILAESARARQQLAARSGWKTTTITLGASPTLARVLVPGLFDRCHKSLAGMRLRVREAFTPILLDQVERGLIDVAIVTNPEPDRSLAMHPLLGEPFALVAQASRGFKPVIPISQLARVPLLITSLHRRIVERQLAPLGGRLNIHAEIDSVDSIRELVLQGRWSTIMPVSVFKETRAAGAVTLSEISGVQLNRLLVLATRLQRYESPAVAIVKELVQAEFARLNRQGVFSFSAPHARKLDRQA
jgi:LysR family nitrogen assimilation transcriptional regulator